MTPDVDPVTAPRLRRQWLTTRPGRSPDDVVTHLLAVQSQDLRGARLAVRARSTGLDATDVDAALAQRRLVVAWLNRGTLHLVTAADYHWLHPLTAPGHAASSRRRLRQEGVSPAQADEGVGLVVDALTREGPLTRSALRDLLDERTIPTAGQALIHVLFAAALRGLVVRGPTVGPGEQAFVATREWIGEAAPVPDDVALARLAVRYLAGHAPSADRDLATWAGIGLGAARRGLAGAGLSPGPDGLYRLPDDPDEPDDPDRAADGLPRPRLLGPFDPVLHGWTARGWVLGPYPGLVTMNGIFTPVLLADGRAVGTWGLPAQRATLEPFEPVPGPTLAALTDDARDVQRYLALPAAEPVVRPPRTQAP